MNTSLIALLLGVAWGPCLAANAGDNPFFDLELEEVLNLEITSVSKKPQTVSQAAAAVFVMTSDDIRRSGVRTIPDVLRMAPGIQVGQISNNAWGVSARGMNGRFTNKLLVLIDGRSVYSPTFSGVYWDVQDLVLADVERIEVIRGPGASLWGANAVNGVINIITKSAAATQGTLVEASTGSDEKFSTTVRHGGKVGDVGHWRVYAKGFDREGSGIAQTDAPGNDAWRQQRAGFRTDLSPSSRDAMTVQGDVYRSRSGETSILNSLTPPYNSIAGTTQQLSGANLLGRWQREVSATDSFTLQGYFDHTERDWPAHLNEDRSTFDVDLQYRTRRFSGHDLVFGAGYRHSRAHLIPSRTGIPGGTLGYGKFNPSSLKRDLYSIFVQDDITLMPKTLVLTLGTKLEHNDYTGYEHQPNARLLWTPSETTSLWGSVARAVRTPSALDGHGTASYAIPPRSANNPAPLPLRYDVLPVPGSENVRTYELGWKQRVTPALSFDLALFHSEYKDLRTTRRFAATSCPGGIIVAPLPGPAGLCAVGFVPSYIYVNALVGNQADGRSNGVELAADWRPLSNLRFQFAWTGLRMEIDARPGTTATDGSSSTPQQQFSLRTAWNPRSDIDVDLWLRHVDKLNEIGVNDVSVKAYTEADLRVAWRPQKNLELALVGRNLLHKRHVEFVSEAADVPVMAMERAFYGQVSWRF